MSTALIPLYESEAQRWGPDPYGQMIAEAKARKRRWEAAAKAAADDAIRKEAARAIRCRTVSLEPLAPIEAAEPEPPAENRSPPSTLKRRPE